MIKVIFDTPKQARETYFINGEQIIKVEASATIKSNTGVEYKRFSYELSPSMNERAIHNFVVDNVKEKCKDFTSLEIIVTIFGNRKFV